MYIHRTRLLSGVVAMAAIFSTTQAIAQDSPTYFLIEDVRVFPEKLETYEDAWKVVISLADTHDYKFPTLMSTSGSRVSIATPLSSFSDIDTMMAERERVFKDGGSAFEKAITTMNKSTFTSSTFLIKHMADVSNSPSEKELESINIYEISRLNISQDSSEKFLDIAKRYKAALAESGLSDKYKYNVYAGGIGADSDYYIQSFAENRMDLAEQRAKRTAKLANNEAMKAVYKDFISIERPGGYTGSDYWNMSSTLSYRPSGE